MSISEEGRLRQGRGIGAREDYKPWIKTREINSLGTACDFPDWKSGRMVSLLSQAELWVYLKLRWNDEVEDIREQFPLDLSTTTEIAKELGVRPHNNGRTYMTTDFLITMKDGMHTALSVKATEAEFKNNRTLELLAIEKKYWDRYGIPIKIAIKDKMSRIEAYNISDVVSCYDLNRVRDEFGIVRHLIAHKKILVDMTEEIDYEKILKKVKGEAVWKETISKLV